MQALKEDIRKRILAHSKREFLANGFEGTSMRTIAEKSQVRVSNIYNYFKSKDDLLKQVLAPLLKVFNEILEEHNSPENITLNVFVSEAYQRKNISMFVKLVEQYRAELKLLLFHAHGSSFENFREEFTNRNTTTGIEYMEKMQGRYPQLNTNVSYFFMHTVSSWWLSIIGEVVSHDDLSHEEIEKFISEFIAFGTAGWERLMKG
ncbi:TetR/AcrR family transcriptional regulator [Marinilabiliaceae bacterium JC017]|nr:TetR/AcrR family transcriptional regulator [Marinilabiliaceae bacterium JC017]